MVVHPALESASTVGSMDANVNFVAILGGNLHICKCFIIFANDMQTKHHLGLLPRIIIAMAIGVAVGMCTPQWVARLVATFNDLFSHYLGFLIPLIIVGFIVPAIAGIGRQAGKMLLATVILAYVATVLSGLFSYTCSTAIIPSLINESLPQTATSANSIAPWFTLDLLPLCGVTTALGLAFLLGLCMASLQSSIAIQLADEFKSMVELVIRRSIIPLLPIYIFGIFHNMTVEGQAAVVIRTFFKIIVVIFVMHVALLLLQYSVAALFAKRNPLKMLRTMLPAYFTALGTQSSAATIPVTLRQAITMGVSNHVAGFVIPLCATIHLSGSTLKIVACALSIMIMQHIPYDFGLFMGFIAMLAVTMVAAPGIPGGAIMAALGILQSILGFTETQCGLMIALYIAMDSFGTACNVTGDGAIATIIDHYFGQQNE